jgi:hypothetical protein
VGFQFQSLGDTYYGFAQVTVNDLLVPQDPLAVTIGVVGYESVSGQPAIVTAVPEPTMLALTGLGLAAMVSRARRRFAA